jgi:Glycosyl transferase family 8
MSNGAIYIVTQDPRYVDLLRTSAERLKTVMPDLPITVFSQFPVNGACFDHVIPVEPSGDGFYDKTRLIRESPYERTIFVDADIYVAEPFPELFSLLDRFDCAATHEEYLDTDWFHRYPRPEIPASFPEFNTGILLFKRSALMDRVLVNWADLYKRFLEENPNVSINGHAINDQPFFRAALYENEARIATLTREYNCKFRGQGYLAGPVKILHGHVDLKFDMEQINKAIAVLNASQRPRVYIAGNVYEQELAGRLVSRRKAHKVGSFPELPGSILLRRAKRLKEVVQQRGIAKTLAKVFATK